MKLLALKDTHFRFGFPHPTGRTDDFESQIYKKIDYIIGLGQEHNVEALIFTGDVFDIKAHSSYSFNAVKANTKIIKKLSTHFKLLTIHGNHDIAYSSLEYKSESFQSHLMSLGLMQDIVTQPFKTENHTIYGVDYTPDHNQLLQQMITIDKTHENLIAVIHEHLVPTDKDRIPFGHCFTYNEITQNLKNHKMIIAGHLHKGYPTQKVNDIIIVNQWNFTRLARDYYSLSGQHIPQVTLIDLQPDSIKTKTFDIPHEPYNNAFIEKDLKREQNLEMDISSFINKTEEAVADTDISFYPSHLKSKIEYYLEQAQQRT